MPGEGSPLDFWYGCLTSYEQFDSMGSDDVKRMLVKNICKQQKCESTRSKLTITGYTNLAFLDDCAANFGQILIKVSWELDAIETT